MGCNFEWIFERLQISEFLLTAIPFGATHDASAMAELCPIAMLFVRCHLGISHTPEELAEEADMQEAVSYLVNFLKCIE